MADMMRPRLVTGRDSWACRLVGRSLPHAPEYSQMRQPCQLGTGPRRINKRVKNFELTRERKHSRDRAGRRSACRASSASTSPPEWKAWNCGRGGMVSAAQDGLGMKHPKTGRQLAKKV